MNKSIITIFLFLVTCLIQAQAQSFDTTVVNNKISFRINAKAINSNLLLLTATSASQTTLIDSIDSEGLAYIKYPDFDKDGNSDILIDYYGNNSTFFLYLFDPLSNQFKEIENYLSYPYSNQLKSNSKYYYSYHRAGCADWNWVSDLFKIQDFKIIHLGHIYGKGCADEEKENPEVIEIYKVINNDEEHGKLIDKLPYLKFIPDFSDKWNFIEKYWNENYGNFK